MNTAEYYITHLQLQRHPEGGFYKETYRSVETLAQQALPNRFSGDRAFSTTILFLVPGNTFSAFHRIAADEGWHFYTGAALDIYVIYEDGRAELKKLGANLAAGESFQHIVPAGAWFASKCSDENSFSLVGCTVAPGFDFADFEMGKQQELLTLFPQHQDWITKLCRL